ncbi:G-protein coupled receptor GRL101-like [Argopecten irradians]|uniref:G-protein coupled receptor GRL101-like n=1 Tax=Argopecten irradians TaxID=31199 RepID=UPI00371B3346
MIRAVLSVYHALICRFTSFTVSYILETSTKTFKEFQNITLICRAPQGANVTWYFRHARTYFVWEYAYDLSLTLAFYNRFRDRYTVSETITDGLLTSVLEITSTLPGDRGWYSCVDVNKTINITTFVDFKYDTCGDNGVQSEKFGCIEFLHEDECANKNGSLAVIHTSQKDKWIYDIAFHVHKATELEIKLGLTLSANTMLWKDLAWVDGSSLTFAQWFGGRLSASECKRCLEEDVPMVLGIKFHMDVGRVWQWVRTQEVACEWREQQHITGIRIAPGRTSYTGDKDLFRCLVSGEYISSEFVCDTASDCWDQSDEEDCGEACSGTSFQCNCGGCVSASTVCDFYWDCSDGSDENNCNYPPCEGRSQWQCNNLQCIASYDVCDGETECADGSDEADILCKENPYIPTAYSYKCSTPDVIFPSARLCDRTLDCVSGNDESTQTMQCLTRVYSCGSLLHNDASNITAVAVSLGLVQYGATNVNCTLKANSMETTWPFENELGKRPLSTYSGSPLISEAVWIDVRPFVVTQIDYTNTEVQLQLVTKATSCVQYIRGCVNVMGRARDSVLVEWISGLNGNTNALNVSVEGCSGYCTTSECKLTPSVQNTQIPTTPNTAGSNWVAITKKDELPVSDVTSEKTIILAVSPLICTEVATDVDPAYASNPKFCKNGMVYYQKDRCLMDFDPTGEPTACRDLTHLQDCEEFECPVNYAKCPGSFCLHQRFICDGRSHCPNQEDEFECDRGTCDVHYKCRSTQQCVPFSQLCDGVRHCRRGDDELNCHPTCPDNCKCRGMTFQCDSDTNIIPLNRIHSDARWINLTTNMSDLRPHVPVSLQLVTTLILKHCSIRELLISGQSLFQNMSALRHLDLSFNNIETLSKNIFPKMWLKVLILSHNPLFRIERDFFSGLNSLSNLQIAHTPLKDLQTSMPRQSVLQHLTKLKDLDLSSNLIEEVPAEVFKDLRSLLTLNLSKNPITTIDITAFVGMQSLHRLTVTHTELQQIRTGTFNDFTSLTYLNISASYIQDIQTDVFANLGNLKTLDIHDNLLEIHEFLFNGLDNLAFLYTDSYKMCCIRPDSVASDNCFAPEESISSCSNLVGLGILRICLWLIGVTAVLGNAFVIIYRTIIDRKHMKKSYSLFVINLSMSDFLMGVYMLIIASVDAHYSGRYVSYDKSWRESALCATAGILSMISSEMSTFIILLITIDRFIAIVFPLSTRKLTWRRAGVVVSIVWLLTIGIAITPQVFIQAYFKGEFYSRSGVCLALPLTGESSPGDEYAAAIFIGLNSLVFLLIVMAQVYIYRTMKGSGSLAATQNRRIEMELAKSLFLVVATDFCCWFPIGVIGLWAQTGGSISPDVYAWVMVLVLPINSAINPFLYTYTYIKRKRTTTSTMRSSTSYTSDRGSLLSSSKTTVPVFYDLQQTNILKEIYFSKLFEGKRGICLESHLSDHLLSPGETFQIAYHIIRGLSFLHLRGIIHGNVSKECVFIKTSKQVVSRATLVMDVKNVSLQHQGPSVDIQQYGTLIKSLLRKLSKR